MKKQYLLLIIVTFIIGSIQARFSSGKTWLDTDGKTIEAHGGGILLVGDTYYWYGENHTLGLGNGIGISCYSSKDLYNWKNEGIVLPKGNIPVQFRDTGVCERPKVLYNEKTKEYVMWMHLDHTFYTASYAGVAVSDSPTGKFVFLGLQRPIAYDYGYPKQDRVLGFPSYEKELGNTYRDMSLFKDDDGKAYVFYCSEELATMYVAQLNDSYTDVLRPNIKGQTWERILINRYREAPAPFKFNGKYYLISSGTSGWLPNKAEIAVADSIFGPWQTIGDPCMGPKSETTFDSQSTYVLPAPGKPAGNFIYMGDRWVAENLEKSTYVWLPFKMNEFGGMKMVFFNQWDLSIFDTKSSELKAPLIKNQESNICWKPVDGADGYKVFKNGYFQSFTRETKFEIPNEFAGQVFNYSVQSWKVNGQNSKPSNQIIKNWKSFKDMFLSDIQPESSFQGWGLLQKDKSIQLPKITIASKVFEKGLGTHAPAEAVYRICGNYPRFTANVGVDDYTLPYNVATVQFEVWGDGLLLFKSKVMQAGDTAVPVDIDIPGVNELKLSVNDAGDGQGWDHANWAEARIHIK